ncbi:MAG: serine/threonine protein kinase [Myxococcaceae bacterium]|nr:serine/threonine protein kinase [Myxococcaceae bacterium]
MYLYQDDALAPGAFIGGWVVERLVSRGVMSNVYRADGGPRGRAALKVLHHAYLHDRVALERFDLEARALAAVEHPAVVRCIDRGELPNGLPYLALEWLDGEPLSSRVERDGPLDLVRASALLEILCSAVGATHAIGLVHRDLKAENVFCLKDGRVKLLDFGIARQFGDAGAGLTTAGHVMGTPIALAPEQIRGGKTSPATDVYALGVLIHVMLTGRPPFDSNVLVDLESMHLNDRSPPLSARARTPPALDVVTRRCLEKEPGARYADAAALWLAWRDALGKPADTLAAGITVRVHAAEGASDEVWEHVDRLERAAGAALERAGFELASDAVLVLGTRDDRGDPAEVAQRWRTFAEGLKRELAPVAGIDVAIAVHVGSESQVLHPLEWPKTSRV